MEEKKIKTYVDEHKITIVVWLTIIKKIITKKNFTDLEQNINLISIYKKNNIEVTDKTFYNVNYYLSNFLHELHYKITLYDKNMKELGLKYFEMTGLNNKHTKLYTRLNFDFLNFIYFNKDLFKELVKGEFLNKIITTSITEKEVLLIINKHLREFYAED